MILAKRDDLIFEGDEFGVHALYPLPLLSQAKFTPPFLEPPIGKTNCQAGIFFREDSFDPTTRIRRGRFYCIAGDESHKNWGADRIKFFPYVNPHSDTDGPPYHHRNNKPPVLTMEIFRPLEITKIPENIKNMTVFLGGENFSSTWRIVTIERIHTKEFFFTLKALSNQGILPGINIEKIPESNRQKIVSAIQKSVDAAYKFQAVPIVDVCRESAREFLAVWLTTIGITNVKGKDLKDLIGMIPEHNLGIRSASTIINRLHSRGKSSTKEASESKGNIIRDIITEDAELSLSLLGFLLREIDWAEV